MRQIFSGIKATDEQIRNICDKFFENPEDKVSTVHAKKVKDGEFNITVNYSLITVAEEDRETYFN